MPQLPACQDCRRYFFDDQWRKSLRGGLPVPRPPGSPPPCFRCPKSTDGRPNPAVEMRGKNARSFELYLSIKAGQPMPDDPGVQRRCGLIELVMARVTMQNASVQPLAQALLATTKRK